MEAIFRQHWGDAVATTARLIGDLELAEDAVQEACSVAVTSWSEHGLPANPGAWLVGTARHKALDTLRRNGRRAATAEEALRRMAERHASSGPLPIEDDQLCLIFTCCHPALAPTVRAALTLRAVCGLTTAQIASMFLMSESAMAQRLVRAKRKIRQAGIPFRIPPAEGLAERLRDVLRVVYLVFTEGHRPSTDGALVRADLCEESIRLGRLLVKLLPREPEVLGLLALMLLVDARRPARVAADGEPVLLEDQDRSRWDRAKIWEGQTLLTEAASMRRPGPYQLQAAIAACHSTADTAAGTNWRQIALLYSELLRWEPSPLIEANRAIAVAMSEGPAAGLVILDTLAADARVAHWPSLHLARAELLRRLARDDDAAAAYRQALALEPPAGEQAVIRRRLRDRTSITGPAPPPPGRDRP